MKRIRVKSILNNETEKEKFISDGEGVIENNIIKYQELDKTKITLSFKEDSVELTRENEESKICFKFIENNETEAIYIMKQLDFEIPIKIFTKSLKVDQSSIIIKYDLLLDETDKKSYDYTIYYKEW